MPEIEGLQDFEREMRRQEDLLYGLALFFECQTLLYAAQPETIDTHRKEMRNIIRAGRQRLSEAEELVAQVRAQAADPSALRRFSLDVFSGHSQAVKLEARAASLVAIYERLFPGRSRAEPFQREELFRLVEEAAESLPPEPDQAPAGG